VLSILHLQSSLASPALWRSSLLPCTTRPVAPPPRPAQAPRSKHQPAINPADAAAAGAAAAAAAGPGEAAGVLATGEGGVRLVTEVRWGRGAERCMGRRPAYGVQGLLRLNAWPVF
jgi:hypothetical protein